MDNRNSMPADAAVSEAIGFILIFSLVIIGIGLVTLYGYPVLLKQQASADLTIMEKNMIVLQNDIKSLCYKSVPYKETSLKVGGGSLNVFNASLTPQHFIVRINGIPVEYTDPFGVNDEFLLPTGNFPPGELRYETTDQGMVVTIENGAVLYRQFGVAGSTMLAQPRWFYDKNTRTAVIYLIGMNSTEMLGESGYGTVQLELAPIEPDYLIEHNLESDRITVEYVPDAAHDYSLAWKNYFVNTLRWSETGVPNTYLLPFDPACISDCTKTLVIKRFDVMVRNL